MSVQIGDITEKIFDNFKKTTPALFAVLIFTSFILFAPQTFLEKLKMSNLSDALIRCVGCTFLLSLSLVLTIVGSAIYRNISKKTKNKHVIKNLKKKYFELNERQQAIIVRLLNSKDKCLELDGNSGDVVFLENNLFIHRPTQIFTPRLDNKIVVKYVPEHWLLDWHNKEPELFNNGK